MTYKIEEKTKKAPAPAKGCGPGPKDSNGGVCLERGSVAFALIIHHVNCFLMVFMRSLRLVFCFFWIKTKRRSLLEHLKKQTTAKNKAQRSD
jgi:cytochrome b subunit of formate dehydrogenase